MTTHEHNGMQKASLTVGLMIPMCPKFVFWADEFFICTTVSRMLCKWLSESSRMLLYFVPGLCGVTEIIGTMLQLL